MFDKLINTEDMVYYCKFCKIGLTFKQYVNSSRHNMHQITFIDGVLEIFDWGVIMSSVIVHEKYCRNPKPYAHKRCRRQTSKLMTIFNEKEPFETDKEYTIRLKKEGEYIKIISDRLWDN